MLPCAEVAAQVIPPVVGVDRRVDTDDPGLHSSARPRLELTSDGMVHAVWQDYREATWTVWYRRMPAFAGAMPEPERRLSSTGINATAPRIATDGLAAVYVTWHQFTVGAETVMFARSLDGGATWSAPVTLAGPAGFASEPEISADAAGRVFVAWSAFDGAQDQVYLDVSLNAGATWTGALRVNAAPNGHSEQPKLANDGLGSVWVGYFDRRFDEHDVFVRRWTAGTGFGTDTPIETSDDAAGALAIAAGPGGTGLVLASWVTFGLDSNNVLVTCLQSNWSLDGGVTWQPAEVAVSPACGAADIPIFLDVTLSPVLDVASGGVERVHAAYGRIDVPSGSAPSPTKIFHNVFTAAGGASGWGVEKKLSTGGAPYPDKGTVFPLPHTRLVGETLGGQRLFVTWMYTEPGYESYFDILASWSTDGGATWAAQTRVTTKLNPGGTRSAFPSLVAAGGNAVIAWDDRREWTPPDELPPGDPWLPGNAVPIGAPDVYLNTITLP